MQLRWTTEAADDLERITNYLFERTPGPADIIQLIYAAPGALLEFPFRGRLGRKVGTRERVLSSLPYVIIYRTDGDAVQILRILHGAQRWP